MTNPKRAQTYPADWHCDTQPSQGAAVAGMKQVIAIKRTSFERLQADFVPEDSEAVRLAAIDALVESEAGR